MRARPGDRWAATARDLYLVAMAVFLVTVGIGILNGIDAVDFSRDLLLAHVHSGTLGWISLGIVATAAWAFGSIDRRMAIALAVCIPLYVAAFASGNLPARAVSGTVLLAVVWWLLAWTWRTYLGSARLLVGIAIALGLTTFTYGATLGVLLQIQFATGNSWLSGDAIGAHAAAMVFSYLVLAGTGIIEWRLRRPAGLSRGGQVQLGALFVGGGVLSVGLLAGAGQAAGGLYLLLNLVAVVLFLVRVVPSAIRIDWASPRPIRHVAAAAIWVVVAIAIFMYIVLLFVTSGGDASKVSTNILIASDHATFIGVMTNLLLALAWGLTTERHSGPPEPGRTMAGVGGAAVGSSRWPAEIAFWGVNAGLAVFVIGLIADSPVVKRLGAPVMGVSILIGLAFIALRLWALREPDDAAPAEEVAGS